jgi:hypothetical protein
VTVQNVRLRAGAANPTTVVLRRITAVAGVTRIAAGTALPFCTVHLFRTSDKAYITSTASDANGSYSFPINDLVAYFVVATRYQEYRADSTALLADSAAWTADLMQLDTASLNSLHGT